MSSLAGQTVRACTACLAAALWCGCAHGPREHGPILIETRPATFLEPNSARPGAAGIGGGEAMRRSVAPPRQANEPAILSPEIAPAAAPAPTSLNELEVLALANDPHVQAEVWALERAQSSAAATGLEFGPYLRGNYNFVPDVEADGSVFGRANQRGTLAVGVSVLDRHVREPHVEAERRAECELALASLRRARADALANVRRNYLEALRELAWIDHYVAIEQQTGRLLPRIEEAVRRKEMLATDLLELRQAHDTSGRQIETRRQLLDQRLVMLAARSGSPAELVPDFAPINQRCRIDPTKIADALATHPDVVATDAEGRRKQAELKKRPYDRTVARMEVGYTAEQNPDSGSSSGPGAAVRFEVPLRQGELRTQNQNEVALLESEVRVRVQTTREQRSATAFEQFSVCLNLRGKAADLVAQLERDKAEHEMIATRRRLGQQTADASEFVEWQAAYRVARAAIALRDAALQTEIAFYEFLHEMGCELLTAELPLGPPTGDPIQPGPSLRPHVIQGTYIAAQQWPTADRDSEFLIQFCRQRQIAWIITQLANLESSAGLAPPALRAAMREQGRLALRANPIAAKEHQVGSAHQVGSESQPTAPWEGTSIWLRAESSDDACRLAERVGSGAATGIVVSIGGIMPYLCSRLGAPVPIAVEIELENLLSAGGNAGSASTVKDRSTSDGPANESLEEAAALVSRLTRTAPGAAEALLRGNGTMPSFWLIVGDLHAFENLDWSKLPKNLPLRLLVRTPAGDQLREADLESRLQAVVNRAGGRIVQVGLADYSDYRRIATR